MFGSLPQPTTDTLGAGADTEAGASTGFTVCSGGVSGCATTCGCGVTGGVTARLLMCVCGLTAAALCGGGMGETSIMRQSAIPKPISNLIELVFPCLRAAFLQVPSC